MSLRQLQRLQNKLFEEQVTQEVSSSSDEDSGEEEVAVTSGGFGALLMGDYDSECSCSHECQSESENVAEELEETVTLNDSAVEETAEDVPEPSAPVLDAATCEDGDSKTASSSKKKSKKKRKNKKKKGKSANSSFAVDDMKDDDDMEFLEQMIADKKDEIAALESCSNMGDRHLQVPYELVFACEASKLNLSHEHERIFGASTVRALRREANTAERGEGVLGANPHAPQVFRGQKNPYFRGGIRRRRQKHQCLFTTEVREHWPPFVSGGLSMDWVEQRDGYNYFMYSQSGEYDRLRGQFEHTVQTADPQQVAYFLRDNPWHIHALVIMSDIYLMHGEYEQAADHLDRCLYALEETWHSNFDPLSGKCRLLFKEEPNKVIFEALSRYCQSLEKKGFFTTALEVAKLVFCLDPDADPMYMWMRMDHLALAAKDYGFILHVNAFLETKMHLTLPNWTYSAAIAAFCDQSQKSNSENALTFLRKAVLAYPHLLYALVTRMADQTASSSLVGIDLTTIDEVTATSWEQIFRSPIFSSCVNSFTSPSTWLRQISQRVSALQQRTSVQAYNILHRISQVYAELNSDTLKTIEIVHFLKSNVAVLCADAANLNVSFEQRFAETEMNRVFYRSHFEKLRVDDIVHRVMVLPADNDFIAAMSEPEGVLDLNAAAADHPLMTFMRTLMPWNNINPNAEAPPGT